MACMIVSNNIPSPEAREAVNTAIRGGIGERDGDWKVVVYQAENYPGVGCKNCRAQTDAFRLDFFRRRANA